MNKLTILITGGHPTPAIAVIEEIQHSHPSWNILWVGRTYALEGSREFSSEYSMLSSMNIPFINLTTGRLQRSLSLYTIPSLLKFPYGVLQSITILRKHKPDIVVSFGGYVALPVAIAAFFLHIPVITHEQVHKPGLANSIIAKIAKKICVTYEDTLAFLPKEKAVVTGLPIRSGIFSPAAKPSFRVPDARLPIIYITGGSTGATTLNEKVFPVIPALLREYIVIHQTGSQSYERAQEIQKQCGEYANRYIVQQFFHTPDVSWIYHHADLVISRSGANTIGELMSFHIPAILVPLPWAAGAEQEKNAVYYLSQEKGMIIRQNKVTTTSIMQGVQTLLQTTKNRKLSPYFGQNTGAMHMVKEIQTLLSSYEDR